MRLIDHKPMIILVFKNDKSLVDFEHFVMNTYFETNMTFDYNLNN